MLRPQSFPLFEAMTMARTLRARARPQKAVSAAPRLCRLHTPLGMAPEVWRLFDEARDCEMLPERLLPPTQRADSETRRDRTA
jgi:hypothetical protein